MQDGSFIYIQQQQQEIRQSFIHWTDIENKFLQVVVALAVGVLLLSFCVRGVTITQ